MTNRVQITQKQTPTFRAAVKRGEDWFDAENDLATAEQLEEEGIARAPITYTVYKSNNSIAPYRYDTDSASVVEGYEDAEIDPSAFISPAEVEAQGLDYNFQFIPESRAVFPFENAGQYFVDFIVYPTDGAALAFRVGVEVS